MEDLKPATALVAAPKPQRAVRHCKQVTKSVTLSDIKPTTAYRTAREAGKGSFGSNCRVPIYGAWQPCRRHDKGYDIVTGTQNPCIAAMPSPARVLPVPTCACDGDRHRGWARVVQHGIVRALQQVQLRARTPQAFQPDGRVRRLDALVLLAVQQAAAGQAQLPAGHAGGGGRPAPATEGAPAPEHGHLHTAKVGPGPMYQPNRAVCMIEEMRQRNQQGTGAALRKRGLQQSHV